jgi:glycosyltransferase involved in cell wall biosynthesis
MEPLISIIMPAYGAEGTLAESIACIQAQHYTHWELLLLVDASPDQTLTIAQRLAAADIRIRLLVGKKNRGVVRARNICLRLTKGSWVAFCDADDFWDPWKLKQQLDLLKSRNANFCYTSATYYRADIRWESAPARMPERLDLRRLLQGNPIGMSTVVVDKKLLNKLYFDALPAGIVHEDYAFWVKLFKKAQPQAVYLPEPSTRVSIHRNTRSGNKWRALKSQYHILRNYGGLSAQQASLNLLTYFFWALYKRGLATWIKQWS